MYERIQYSTEEIREVIQTLRRIYDNAEKNLKEWTQIKVLLQELSLIHISEPTRLPPRSRMPSSA